MRSLCNSSARAYFLLWLAGWSLGWGASILRADSTVVFNEILYSPPSARPELEWVELYNQMAVDMDISGWALAEGIFFNFPEGTVLPGGGFIVVAASPEDLKAATGFDGALGPFDGRLDSSGEKLELHNNNSRVMDAVRYRDSGEWPVAADGSGCSLAKKDPDMASAPAASWTHSAQVGGTPGAHNFPRPGGPQALPAGLVSYWCMDEGSGRYLDSGQGNHGTGGAGTTRVAGLVGAGAARFNNTTSAFINVGTGVSSSFSVSEGITLEALLAVEWEGAEGDADDIFRKEDGAKRVLLAFQNDGLGGEANPPVGPGPALSFGLNVGGTYGELDLLLDGLEGRPSLSSLKDGRPHHVAATYASASGLKALHVDGKLVASVSLAPGPVQSGGTTAAYIGNMAGRAESFTGTIDEVAFWKVALSADEIARHWALAGEGRSYFTPPDEPPGDETPALALNELVPAGSGPSWLEIINLGEKAANLEGCVLARLGQQSAELVLPAETLDALGRRVFSEAQLGFVLEEGDRLFLLTPNRKIVLDGALVGAEVLARHPEGAGAWLRPAQPSPGAENAFELHDEIVVNEIFYHPRLPLDGVESEEAWIELYNKSDRAVDMSGWSLAGGIDYSFEDETTLGPGEHLVVSNDKARLSARYPAARIVGDFQRRLSRKSDRILLSDSSGNPADDVVYHDEFPWPGHADGGGSSLELIDPRADNSRPEAWAASDESVRSAWKAYSIKGLAAANLGPAVWNELVFGLHEPGEVLLDDLSVVETPGTATAKELIQGGDFEAGASHWRFLGTHRHSALIEDPEQPSQHVLHLVATGSTEHMHNHVETTLAGNVRIAANKEYQVSFRAKWLAGSNALNIRLYFNRLPRTITLDVPADSGTPGARNSAFAENIGPTFSGLKHDPVVPAAGGEVTVSVKAADPDGVAGATLWWSVNGAAWQSASMTVGAGGLASGSIPGQAAGALVQFYVEAADARGAVTSSPAGGRDSRALYRVQDGQASKKRVHTLRILMPAADATFLHQETNVMSNEWLPATVVYDELKAFYDVGVRLKGSQRGRPVSERVGFHIKFPPDDLFRGVHSTVGIDRSGGWKFGRIYGQDEIVIKHIVNHAGGIPGMYDDIAHVVAPRAAQTGSALLIMAAFGDVFLDSQWPGGSDGPSYKYELVYYPTTTVDGRPEGLKRPQPDQVMGTDLRNLGDDKELYRWFFLLENARDRDDYSGMMALCKAFSLPTASLDAGTRAVMDIDEWMRTFAMYSLCGVGDTYTQGNYHNNIYYFRPHDQKMLVFPWDMDFAFTQSTSAALWGDQGLARIITLTPNRRLFYGHLLDLISTTFNTAYMSRWVTHYGSLCGQDFSAINSSIQQRGTFVKGAIPARVTFALRTNGGADFETSETRSILEGDAWFDVKSIVLLGHAEPPEPSWTTLTRWNVTADLKPGPNRFEFVALDFAGDVVAADSITVTRTGAEPEFIRGDAAMDGRVNLTDPVHVLLYLFQAGSLPCLDAADSNDSEKLDLTDAVYLLNHLFKGGPAPPAPYPERGLDPGADPSLGCAQPLGVP